MTMLHYVSVKGPEDAITTLSERIFNEAGPARIYISTGCQM